jgi:HPt (histidine-containing phosphotransfer) domain-containing protein
MSDEIPILDDAVLAELRESVGGDDEFVAELVGTYLAEGETHLSEMIGALAGGDPAAIVRPAHSLKSSSAALGAARLSTICREIEHAGREGRFDGLPASLEVAQAAWEATVAEMTARGLAG